MSVTMKTKTVKEMVIRDPGGGGGAMFLLELSEAERKELVPNAHSARGGTLYNSYGSL
jgi:hypothetical protein